MAQIARVKDKVAPVLVVVTTKTYSETPLLEDVERGQLLKETGTGWRLAHPTERADGQAMKNGYEGQVGFDIMVIGEFGGFSGLTPGQKLYTDPATNGEISNTAINGFLPQIHVDRPDRIRVNYTI